MKVYKISAFDAIQCEEQINVTPEEMEEVLIEIAREAADFEGYGEWAEEVEKHWLNGYSNGRQGPKAGAFDI
jgi:hypothetical protein